MADSTDREVSYVPPPPNDVSVRTMESDIRSMALSGGSFVKPERVAMGSRQKKDSLSDTSATPEIDVPQPGGRSKFFLLAIIVLSALFLGGVVYFIYPLIFGSEREPVVPDTGGQPVLPAPPEDVLSTSFTHQSFFRKSGDAVLDMNVVFSGGRLSDPESYPDKIFKVVQSTALNSLIEFSVRRPGGQHLTAYDFAVFSDLTGFDQDFLTANFEPDFTFFVYKNLDGVWPGLVLKPREGKSWVAIKPEVSNRIESGQSILNLFASSPGFKDESFRDILISGQPARSLTFSKPSAKLVYGWFLNYVVISTSEEGLKETVGRL